MLTIKEQWLSFKASVMPPDAPAIQVREMKLAFYAGFHAYEKIAYQLSKTTDGTQAIINLESLSIEGRQFVEFFKTTGPHETGDI